MSDLADRLGYRYRDPGAVHRALIRFFATKPLAAVNARVAGPLDRSILKLTGGRATATSVLTGLPVVWVTTTGAKSGEKRTVPLLGIPVDGTVALIGTGFGQKPTPGWVFNLRANPSASVAYRGHEVDVSARLARVEELDRIWERAKALYPGYGKYPVWASHREISVFMLES